MHRNIYLNDETGKRKAIANIQFALEDIHPWFMNAKFKPNETAIAKGKFANWVTHETFDLACKAILNALEPIYLYQFEDTLELNPAMELDWDVPDSRKKLG